MALGMDWLIWTEVGLIFSSFNAMQKITQKNILVSTPWGSLFDVFLQEHFV